MELTYILANREGFTLDQISYVKELNQVQISEMRKQNKNDEVNDKEQTDMRAAIGKLNWLKSQTRPDIAFEVSIAHHKCIKRE